MPDLLRAGTARSLANLGRPGGPTTDVGATVIAGTTIRELDDLDELRAACAVFAAVWARADGDQILPIEILRALTHAGNYAAGAFADGQLLGAVVGFLGDHAGVPILHSHIMGLLPDARGRGLGHALKHHQRRWTLARGIETITWTFDPLVRANAHLNLTKLGATSSQYLVDFYGSMSDEVNEGAGSDRLLVTWELGSEAAQASAQAGLSAPGEAALLRSGAAIVLDEAPDGRPEPQRASAEADVLLCRVPDDILALRRDDPARASAWRQAVREHLGGAIEDGFVATAVTDAGAYVLQRNPTSRPASARTQHD